MASWFNVVFVFCCLFVLIQAGPNHGHAHHGHAHGVHKKAGHSQSTSTNQVYEVVVQIFSGREPPTWNYTMQHIQDSKKGNGNINTLVTALNRMSQIPDFAKSLNKELNWTQQGYAGFEIIHYVDDIPEHTWFIHPCFNTMLEKGLLQNIPAEFITESITSARQLIYTHIDSNCPAKRSRKPSSATKVKAAGKTPA